MEDLIRRQIADKFEKFKEDIKRNSGVEISNAWLADKIQIELDASIDREFKGRFFGASSGHLSSCKEYLALPPEPTIQDLPESKVEDPFTGSAISGKPIDYATEKALQGIGKKKPSKSK